MGVDIDQEEIEFLAQVTNFKFLPGDILVDELPKADMYWLFKILPLLDRQQLGSAKEILQKIPAKYVVVTYPTASIGGKNKGMRETYQNQFSELMTELGYEFKSLNGVNELVYVVYKE
jgi:16S rRNA (guanine(1405)-N(7))-methyltransferase